MEKIEAIEEKPSVECHSRKRKNMCQSISYRTGYSLVRDLRSRRVSTRYVHSVLEGEDCGNLKMVADPYLDAGKPINGEPEVPQSLVSRAELEERMVRDGENLKVHANLSNGTASKGKTAVNACRRKKVFANASSVSYQRLLPYLMDTMNVIDPGLSNFEIVDARNPCQTARLQKLNSEVRSSSMNDYTATSETVVSRFDAKVKLEKEDIPGFSTQVPRNGQSLNCAPENFMPQVDDVEHESLDKVKLEKEDIPKVPSEVPCNGQSLNCAPENFMPQVDDLERESLDKVKLEKEDIPKVPTEVPCNGQSLSCAPENFVPQVGDLEHKGTDNVSSVLDDLMKQEHCQMTPPDADIVVKTDSDYHENTTTESNSVSENKTEWGSPVASEQTNNSDFEQTPNFEDGVNPINGMILKPCSRLGVFNNIRSLSYRRLFPFLMNMSKDNSGASMVTEHPKPELSEDLRSPSATSAEQNYASEAATENSYEKQSSEETVPVPNADVLSPDTNTNPPMPQLLSTNCSSTTEDSITLFQPCSIANDGNLTDQSNLDESGPAEKPKGCFFLAQDAHNSDGESVNKDSLRQSSVRIGASDSPVVPNYVKQEDAHKSEVKSVDEPSLSPSSFQIEPSDAPMTPSIGPFKGILNGNPRGCRGLCNCLNCASFKLHADRAFEFSRNQMHDAAEVAFTLMEELKNIRSILEKSVRNDNDLDVPQLNMVRVKEACNKALETENIAKERLSQMNYELNIHCRIPALQQPKVTFANHLQERLVPVEHPSTRAEEKRRSFITKRLKVNR